MSTQFTVPIYQRKSGRGFEWTTVALGPFTDNQSGRSLVKMQRKLTERLRKRITAAAPAELEDLQLTRGLRLERLHLEITVRGSSGSSHVAGTFPVIREPRWLGEEHRVWILYHPQRQNEWIAVPEEASLEEPVTAFFRLRWAGLAEEDLDALKTNGKDSLRSISFSAVPRCLTDELGDEPAGGRGKRSSGGVLAEIGVDTTQRLVEEGRPSGAPREPYRAQMDLLLGGRNRRPVIVVGPPGSGKSTVIEQWIRDLATGEEYEIHHNLDRIHHVWRISGKRLIAGMSRLGDWEQRCVDLLAECRKNRVILWVDDLHLFGRLGQTRDSDRSLANFFRAAVARGELIIVGECTVEQAQRLDDDAPSFSDVFSRVRVEPTTPAETLRMAISEARELEQRHPCDFHPFSFRTVLEVGGSLFPWKAFPGTALDIVRQLAEHAVATPEGRQRIDSGDVIRLLSSQTGLAEHLLTLDERLEVDEVRQSLARRVIGQDEAVAAVYDLIFRIRAGLTDPARPHAVFLFTGPTGTGKTELAKATAEYLFGDPSRLLRFDMSEYSGPDASARLIGDRWSPEGQLTRRIGEQPFSVLLLDEIEKAHRSVLNLLLQLLDEGRLTDAAGNTASFQNTVIVMTSNLGGRSTLPIGFGESTSTILADIDKAVREFFPPELFNRIDRVVRFVPLTDEVAERIATKELAQLLGRRGLTERNIFVYANRAVRERIVRQAFDPRYGARTVKRYLEHEIGSRLVEEINRGTRASMQVMRLYEADDQLQLHVDPLVEAEPAAGTWMLESDIDSPALHLWPLLEEAMGELDRVRRGRRKSRATGTARFYADTYDNRVSALWDWYSEQRRRRPDPEPSDAHARTPKGESEVGRRPRRVDRRSSTRRAPPATRDVMLDRIAEACTLARNVDQVTRGRHDTWVELLRVGTRGGATTSEPGLLEWMTDAYLRGGLVERTGVRFVDGAITEKEKVESLADFASKRERRPVQVMLYASGLFSHELFLGDQGSHIWRSFTEEPEIVRVRVFSTRKRTTARELLGEHLGKVKGFEAALEEGRKRLPVNPERLLPTTRVLTFRPPLRPGEGFPVEIEDFHLGWAGTLNVSSIGQALDRLRIMRASRRADS